MALTEAGALGRYVTVYMSKGGLGERALSSLPALGPLMRKRLLNRGKWPGLERRHIVTLPLPIVAVRDAVGRTRSAQRGRLKRADRALTAWFDRSLDSLASRFVGECDAVLAVNNCALKTFREAKRQGKPTFLDYPIGHHRSKAQVMAAEAARWPDYADSWKEDDEPPGRLARQDDEIALADRIWVGSEFVKRTFVENGTDPDKLFVLPYGTDLGRFWSIERATKDGPVRCLFVGQVSQRKGASYLFEAFRRPFTVDVQLVLAGSVQVDPRLIPDGVVVAGHLTAPELDKLYAKCDVFVLPTLWEGMPLSVLEAMAAGLPVVSTPCGPDQVVRDGTDGLIVPSRDPEALRSAVERIASDPALRSAMGASARQRSREFTWETYRSRCLEDLSCALR
jgi:glycosyltransferase involved in cell wall biosynthesis